MPSNIHRLKTWDEIESFLTNLAIERNYGSNDNKTELHLQNNVTMNSNHNYGCCCNKNDNQQNNKKNTKNNQNMLSYFTMNYKLILPLGIALIAGGYFWIKKKENKK